MSNFESLKNELKAQVKCEIHTDNVHKILFATDASMYREMPLAVAYPENKQDLIDIVKFAAKHKLPLIPRASGTSLAGQVVGKGIVIEIGRHFNKLIEVNAKEKWARVLPGLIRDDLNLQIKQQGHDLLFGPETATANRAMIGGMIGNNSCGGHSIIWGSMRDHLLECEAILHDGSVVTFKAISAEEFHEKRKQNTLEGQLYAQIYNELVPEEVQKEIVAEYPKYHIPRRNTGYAIDLLLRSNVFTPGGPDFNFCSLVAGSEGTLCIVTEAKLNLVDTLKAHTAVFASFHHDKVEALKANVELVKFGPAACEMIDDFTVKLAQTNNTAKQNTYWIKGEPQGIIIAELSYDTAEELNATMDKIEATLRAKGLGYDYGRNIGDDAKPIWTLRKAVLGLMYSKPSDVKPINLVEDCAVDVNDLPMFYKEHEEMMKAKGVEVTTSAHAGTGELHTLPYINLKTAEGHRIMREILEETVTLVKRYNGSLSGEHGDGRLRAEFIEAMIGANNYQLIRRIKQQWDPNNIFNPNKIIDAPKMDTDLRYTADQVVPEIPTHFNWDHQGGIIRATELCNGTAECKKSGLSGGLMCPSYMATHNEMHTTRGRANVVREFLTNSNKTNRFNHKEIYEAMDLCLSCKACKSECPSSVDVAKLKAEFLQQYYNENGVPFRAKMVKEFTSLMKLAVPMSPIYNFFASNSLTSGIIKSVVGLAPGRSLPMLEGKTLSSWYYKNKSRLENVSNAKGSVYIFIDEFTNVTDVYVGITAIELLNKLGYKVLHVPHVDSGRAHLSKGFVTEAKDYAKRNISTFRNIISEKTPLIAIEPSTISAFRDEYPDLVEKSQRDEAKKLATNCLFFEEFICREASKGNITSDMFTDQKQDVLFHGHCHVKALSSTMFVRKALELPKNYKVSEMNTSCCGMAGSFGYEKEHFELSQKVAELHLFPSIRKAAPGTKISASGTSCRHQIKDGVKAKAKHTAEILFEALKK